MPTSQLTHDDTQLGLNNGRYSGWDPGSFPSAPPAKLSSILTVVLEGCQSGDQDVEEEPQEDEANEE